MPIPPRVSVVALHTMDLERSTAFYAALGWELSPASTTAMSLFKTAGSLLLLWTDDLIAEMGGDEVSAAVQGEPTGEALLSIHVATDEEVAAAVLDAAEAGGVVVKQPTATPLGGSYAFFADPDGHLWGGHPPPAVPTRRRRATQHSLAAKSSDGWPESASWLAWPAQPRVLSTAKPAVGCRAPMKVTSLGA